MGLGDAKLLAVVGFWFGWLSIPFTIFISSLVALILVVPSILNKSDEEVIATKFPFLDTAKDSKFCDFRKEDIARMSQILVPSFVFRHKILFS